MLVQSLHREYAAWNVEAGKLFLWWHSRSPAAQRWNAIETYSIHMTEYESLRSPQKNEAPLVHRKMTRLPHAARPHRRNEARESPIKHGLRGEFVYLSIVIVREYFYGLRSELILISISDIIPCGPSPVYKRYFLYHKSQDSVLFALGTYEIADVNLHQSRKGSLLPGPTCRLSVSPHVTDVTVAKARIYLYSGAS